MSSTVKWHTAQLRPRSAASGGPQHPELHHHSDREICRVMDKDMKLLDSGDTTAGTGLKIDALRVCEAM